MPPELDGSPDGLARHSAEASEHSQQDAGAASVLRGSAERAVPLADVPPAPAVPRGGPVQGGPVQGGPGRGERVRGERVRGERVRGGPAPTGPGEPRWAALREQRVLPVWVRLGAPSPERAGRQGAKSSGCGQPGKPPDARRGRP